MVELKEANAVIQPCAPSDIQAVMRFIHEHWKSGHILSLNRSFLDWQHKNKNNPYYNFIIAKDKSNGAVLGVLGYITNTQYDPALTDKTVWLALWRVCDDAGAPGIGLALRRFLEEFEKPQAIGVIGISQSTLMLYKPFGYEQGALNQFYMVNKNKKAFKLIGGFDNRYESNADVDSGKKLVKIDKRDWTKLTKGVKFPHNEQSAPQKSPAYFQNRYLDHPIYQYEIYALEENMDLKGLFVVRKAEYQGNYALRCVDHWGRGEDMSGLKAEFQDLLAAYDAEYLDILNFGIEDIYFEKAGLLKLDPRKPVVIPNHYEPFEQKNVHLHFAMKTDKPYVIFKGDGDQDRPSREGKTS